MKLAPASASDDMALESAKATLRKRNPIPESIAQLKGLGGDALAKAYQMRTILQDLSRRVAKLEGANANR